MALLLTFICGLFFLIGIVLYKFVNHKNEVTIASLLCATIVIIGLIVFDIGIELIELHNWWLLLFILLGLVLITLIDKIVPHHHHEHHDHDEEGEDHQRHLNHINVVIIIALLLHNMIEGMGLFGVASNDLKSGILMTIGICLHNLPFGFQIASYKKTNKLLIFLLVVSGLLGGLILSIFGELNPLVEGCILAFTFGMLLHLLLFEFLPEVWKNIKNKASIIGAIIGIIILIIINVI